MSGEKSEYVLLTCRELMQKHISSSMAMMMKEAETVLYNLADKEKGLGKASQYFAALRLFRTKHREIQVRFENRFISLFKYRSKYFISNDDTDVTLSKVGHSSFRKEIDSSEEKKVIEASIDKVKLNCHSALLNLDRRMGSLLKDIKLDHTKNPLQPETVFEAFWESCRDVKMDLEVRLLLINLFEKYVALDLKCFYEELSTHLSQLNEE